MSESPTEHVSDDTRADQAGVEVKPVSENVAERTLSSRLETAFPGYVFFATVLAVLFAYINAYIVIGGSVLTGLFPATSSSLAVSLVLYITESFWRKTSVVNAGSAGRNLRVKPRIGVLVLIVALCSCVLGVVFQIVYGSETLASLLIILADPGFIYIVMIYSGTVISALYLAPLVSRTFNGLGIELPYFIQRLSIIDLEPGGQHSKNAGHGHNGVNVVHDPLQKAMSELPETISATIRGLLERAERLGTINHLILSAIMLVLIGAALFIVYAGEIATKDTQAVRPVLGLLQQIDSIEEDIQTLELGLVSNAAQVADVELSASQSDNVTEDLPGTSTPGKAEQLMRASGAEHGLIELESQREVIESQIERKKVRLQLVLDLYTKAQAQEFAAGDIDPNPADTADLLIAAGITRFGVLVITIYLVQILVNLYRYNSKVLSVYLAQADSLMLVGQSPKKIGDLLEKLAPTVEFGNPPSSLPERVYERFDDIARSAMAKALHSGAAKDMPKS